MCKKLASLFVFSVFLLTGCQSNKTIKSVNSSVYCENDLDCTLYNCANCGNKTWVDYNEQVNENCHQVNKISCECISNFCKRVYKK